MTSLHVLTYSRDSIGNYQIDDVDLGTDGTDRTKERLVPLVELRFDPWTVLF